jgi:hypothetical protein
LREGIFHFTVDGAYLRHELSTFSNPLKHTDYTDNYQSLTHISVGKSFHGHILVNVLVLDLIVILVHVHVLITFRFIKNILIWIDIESPLFIAFGPNYVHHKKISSFNALGSSLLHHHVCHRQVQEGKPEGHGASCSGPLGRTS